MAIPVPLEGCDVVIPAGLVLVQLNVELAILLVRTISTLEVPEQISCVEGVDVATGSGFTSMLFEIVALHPPDTKPFPTTNVTV